MNSAFLLISLKWEKDVVQIKHLPNIISTLRILISCSLPFLHHNLVLFFAAYFVCGISDVLDGYIAHRYKWESKAGAKLDSLSDFAFYAIILYLLFFTTDIISQKWLVVGFVVVFILRAANLLITKMKFGEWDMLHSWGNKAAGLLLFLSIPFTLITGTISFLPGIILFAVAFASAVEEMIILISAKEYDVNKKSYFILPVEKDVAFEKRK